MGWFAIASGFALCGIQVFRGGPGIMEFKGGLRGTQVGGIKNGLSVQRYLWLCDKQMKYRQPCAT